MLWNYPRSNYMIIMDNFILDDLIDHLFYKSKDKVVDDFIRYNQNNLMSGIMEFVPYDQFKDIRFIAKVESYEAIWIEGNIQYWSYLDMKFKRNGPMQVVLKKLNNSENITSK